MKKLLYCIYILHSRKDQNFYIGFTTDLKRRLTEHFQGRSKSTAYRRPFELIFCEYYRSKEDAMRRETYFKSTKGNRTLRLMLQSSLEDLKNEKDNECSKVES